MAVDAKAFRSGLGRFASGVTIVTVRGGATSPDERDDCGMTVSAFSSVSLDPPLVLVCIQKDKLAHARLLAADGFAVSVLGADQKEMSNRFAGFGPPGTPGGAGQDRFEGLAFERGAVSGAALIPGAMLWLDCAKYAAYDGGDHTIFLGEVRGLAAHGEGQEPLLYFASRYRGIGDAL